MKNMFLLCAVTAVFLVGYFFVKRLDVFLTEYRHQEAQLPDTDDFIMPQEKQERNISCEEVQIHE